MSTKKASRKNAAVQSKKPEGAEKRIGQEVPAAVLGGAWIEGISLAGGQANIAVRLDVPPPTMKENPKWPFTQWYVDNLTKQLQKDLRRVAQTIANSAYVRGLVESRTAAKAASKPAPPAVVAQAQPAGERPTVGQ
jgi:hypothetical protein